MKKILSVLFAAAVLATCMIGFSACGDDGTHTVTIVTRHMDPITAEYTEEESEIYITVEDGAVLSMTEISGEYTISPSESEPIYDGAYWYGFFLDRACVTKYASTPILSDTTLYAWQFPGHEIPYSVTYFIYNGKTYLYHALPGAELSADAFSRSAYGIGAPEDYLYFSDEACTQPYTLEGDVMPKKDMFRSVYVIDAE